MFDCCRIPGPSGLDWSVSYSKEGETGHTGHIVVVRKNRFWKINATYSNGRILGIDELERSALVCSYQELLKISVQAIPVYL